MTVQLFCGDAVKWARAYSGEPFHALLADPPYHLVSIIKRYGKSGPTEANLKLAPGQGNSPYERGARGFMGKQWDGGDVAFQPETWAAFLSVMYPGAFGMAFASSRGWHRLACAIEDGGAVIHPSIFGWSYGSGFPKATRVNHGHAKTESFSGHRYGLQALKPALEPIIVFQKPYEGRPIDNITETGAGVLNISGGRVSGQVTTNPLVRNAGGYQSNGLANQENPPPSVTSDGRWPANFLLLDEEAAAALDRQSGASGGDKRTEYAKQTRKNGTFESGFKELTGAIYGDSGGASRFFFRVSEQLDDTDPVRYCAKASRNERDAGLEEFPLKPSYMVENGSRGYENSDGANRGARETKLHNPHPTVKPLALTKYLATLLLPPADYAPRRLFIPFAGVASEVIGGMQAGWDEITGVELTEEYIPIAEARVAHWSKRQMVMDFSGGTPWMS